ncbi:uncharacterized protein LOC135475811 [Liolophura sinensis]|uniref:uncharacterized protein LOC135475811 n=1 Tax=Liolophura sinensis TaxID=3198878 RepID=UPI0031583237
MKTRYIPRPGTVSLQRLHDSGFIDLDDTTVPVTQRKKEFTQEDLTRTVDDVRNVVTEELRHCSRDILIAIESILKLTGKSPENACPSTGGSSNNSSRAEGNFSPGKVHSNDSSSGRSAEDAFVKMSAIHREVLKRNKDVILGQLIYTLPVIDLLYSRGFMDIAMATELRQQPSSSQRSEKLLKLMPRLPDEGFYIFCEGLASVGLNAVAQQLQNSSKELKAGCNIAIVINSSLREPCDTCLPLLIARRCILSSKQ